MDTQTALDRVETAAAEGRLSPGAVNNVRAWLTEPRYAEYAPQVVEHVEAGRWKELDDYFWTVIPFGTGGRRGKLYPIGSNAINDRTIGESAQGLADYVKDYVRAQTSEVSGTSEVCGGRPTTASRLDRDVPSPPAPLPERERGVAFDRPLACAVAYDTRHQSRHFAELASEIMAAAGYTVYFLDGYRSTPELSFAVRHKHCSCGIMITASHNPPSDNAVKAYWCTGGQLLPPHDQGVIDRVMAVAQIQRIPFQEGLKSGQIVYCQDEVDATFIAAVAAQSRPGPRDLKIIYSPLHGVGASAVCPALAAVGFKDVEVFGPHAAPDPDFTNVPDHIANPERPVVFDAMIQRARQTGADLILATDPDCDRLGCAAPKTLRPDASWATLTGNQIGALLADYLLEAGKRAGTLTPEHYIVKTLVTTELMRRIADAHGVQTIGDLLVGFKYIGGVIEERDPAKFVMGAEESYGFLVGAHARDKDAAVAAMLLAEIAARAKAEGTSLHEKLEGLFLRYGCHVERAFSIRMPGAEGMERMKALMSRFRQEAPQSLGGMAVARVRDYQSNLVIEGGGRPKPLSGPTGDMVMFDLAAEGNYVAVRPSGTEPIVKFYTFAYQPPAEVHDVEASRAYLASRLEAVERDLKAAADVG